MSRKFAGFLLLSSPTVFQQQNQDAARNGARTWWWSEGRKITARETLAQGKITVPIASDCTRLLSPQTQPIRALSTLVQGRLLRLGDTVVVESRESEHPSQFFGTRRSGLCSGSGCPGAQGARSTRRDLRSVSRSLRRGSRCL